jgi:hypothetical protein
MLIKHFGAITAIVDDQARSIELRWSPRYRDPLDSKYPQRCLRWAIGSLAEFTDQGYEITPPEPVNA